MNREKPREPIPRMNYRQYRHMRKLVHECCNYDNGNCIALDDGEECVCVQSISYSLLCKWFRAAVLPLDKELEAELYPQKNTRLCAECSQPFHAAHKNALYCEACAAEHTPVGASATGHGKTGQAVEKAPLKAPVISMLFRAGQRVVKVFIPFTPKSALFISTFSAERRTYE